MRLSTVTVARARHGRDPRTKRQARLLRERLVAEQQVGSREMVSKGVFK